MTENVWGIDTIEGVLDQGLYPPAPPVIWAYKTGTVQHPDIEWTEADLAEFPESQVYRIHQGFGERDPFRTLDGIPWDEADLEAGAWDVRDLAVAIDKRNGARWSTRVYASDQPWTELLVACNEMRVHTRSVYWREANWSLSQLQARARLGGQRYAVQWASPTSNPMTLVPGTGRTLQQVNADLNVIRLASTAWQG